jgi:hypothetical protein
MRLRSTLAVFAASCVVAACSGGGSAPAVDRGAHPSPATLVRLLTSAPHVRDFALRLHRHGEVSGNVLSDQLEVAHYDLAAHAYNERLGAGEGLPAYQIISIGPDLYVSPSGSKWVRLVRDAAAFGVLAPKQPAAPLEPLVEDATSVEQFPATSISHTTVDHYHANESLADFLNATGAQNPYTKGGTVTTDLYLDKRGLPVRVVDVQRILVGSKVLTETTTRSYSAYGTSVTVKPPAAAAVTRTIHVASEAELSSALTNVLKGQQTGA